jgi:ferritin-like metal-binding protein YciE
MGHGEAAELLQTTLDEEKSADEKLTEIAESGIDHQAAELAHPAEDEVEDTAPAKRSRTPAGQSVKRMTRRG